MTRQKTAKEQLTASEVGIALTKDPIPTPDTVDVFVCIFDPTDGQRLEWAKQAVRAWQSYEDARVMIITPGDKKFMDGYTLLADTLGIQFGQLVGISFTGEEFQRGRRIVAEGLANSPVYILADDDCVPVGRSFLRRAVDILAREEYRSFAILSAMPLEAQISEWFPEREEYRAGVLTDDQVMEHVDVGGIRITRKGVMGSDSSEWDVQPQDVHGVPIEQSGAKYDRQHAIQIRQRGYRVGYARALKMKHLGEIPRPAELPPERGELDLETA